MKTYVNASYAVYNDMDVHNDMYGNSGELVSIGKGVIHIKTSKQKLNTKSSTETEIAATSDYTP